MRVILSKSTACSVFTSMPFLLYLFTTKPDRTPFPGQVSGGQHTIRRPHQRGLYGGGDGGCQTGRSKQYLVSPALKIPGNPV